MPSKKKEAEKADEASILEQLLQELEQEIDAKEGAVSRKITKGQALIKSMVNEALKGDQRMMGNVLKFMEKLDALHAARKKEAKEKATPMAKHDWGMMFHFFGRYQPHIELEIARMKKENPGAFALQWNEIKIEDAPWYEDLHGNEGTR